MRSRARSAPAQIRVARLCHWRDRSRRFGFSPSDSDYCVRIVSSNPYAGDNSAEADAQGGITVKSNFSVGNINQVDVDVYASS